MRERWALGTMTGTSLDALDISLIHASGEGLSMRVHIEAHATHDLGGLRPRLRAAAEGAALSARDFASLALDFGRMHAQAMQAMAGERRIDLAAIHGQTIYHAPPLSWQLVNPWPVAHALHCPVVSDLRGADLALGGQGAPITPLADWILFRDNAPQVIVNLGGFCNITWLPGADATLDAIGGADVCPCNHLLDAAARTALQQPFDRDGACAASGTPSPDARGELLALLELATRAGRSLGTGDEAVTWVARHARSLRPADLLATTCDAIGSHIGATAMLRAPAAQQLVLAGGGARNRALCVSMQRGAGGVPTHHSADRGVPVEARESAEMAVLGLLALDGVPITLPAVTRRGATRARDGLWCLPAT